MKRKTKYENLRRLRDFRFFALLILFHLNLVNAQFDNDSDNNNDLEGSIKIQLAKETAQKSNKPNIVIILIDDLGFDDLSFRGSNQILTPNIDALAYNGIILNRHYVPNLCTPSRATLLTGKYPIHTGTQHFVIVNDEPWGLPLSERLMPEIFRENGYSTNLIGKWHLGFYKKEMTPTMRGFDYHYGYYSGYIDYYDHTLKMLDRNYSYGVDYRRNLKPWHQANGCYATDDFTRETMRVIKTHDKRKPLFLIMSHLAVHTGNEDNPMQAPAAEVNKFSHITDPKRRTYAGMVSSLDDSVGKVMRALANKGILNNTIVLLYSDNGAPTEGIHSNAGSNFPFRGQKEGPWEGGIRSTGLIYSPLFNEQSYVSNQVIHASDWLPTLARAAGIQLPAELKLDGVDQWDTLSHKLPQKSRSLLHVLDDDFGYMSYMRGNMKILNGSRFDGKYDGWLGNNATSLEEEHPLAQFYVQTVLSSEVQAVIDPKYTKLSIRSIEKLRAESTNRCPPLPMGADPTAEIYRCEPLKAPCLFNIEEDPCEKLNLARLQPQVFDSLYADVEALRETSRPSARVAYSDPLANPALHNGNWEWWSDTDKNNASLLQSTKSLSKFWLSLYSSMICYRH